MMVKEGYKEVRIGPKKETIPNNWGVKSLSDIADFINGKGFSSSDWEDEGLPIVRIQNLNDSDADYNYYSGEVKNKYRLDNGDILLSWSASLGAYKWNRGKALLNQHIFKVEPKENIDKKFMYQLLQVTVDKLINKTHGSTMKHIRKKELDLTYFPYPPKKEQKKIAAILSSVDKTIEKTGQVIEKTKELKKGLMQQLLTKGIGHSEFKDININGKNLKIPVNWDLKLIKEVAKINKSNISTDTPKNYEIEYIDISSINDIGEIEETNIYKYKDAPSRAKRLVDLNDVIVSTVRPYLKSFSVIKRQQENLVCSTGFAVLSPKTNIISGYIYYFVWSNHFVNYMKRLMRGTSYPAVNINDVANTYLPLPPLEEQKKIANILLTVDNKIQKEEEYKEKLEELKKGLMQKLLTGEVRVKVAN